MATPEITIPRAAPIADMVLQYNGVNDYLFIPELLLGQTIDQMSIEAWVYIEKITGSQTIWRNSDVNNTAFFLAFNNQNLQFGHNSAQVVTFPFVFGINLWYYVVLTYNVPTQQAILYVNAVAQTAAALTNSQKIKIGPATAGGASTTGVGLQGGIGTIRVWKGILGLTNVQHFMYMTLTGNIQARSSTGQVVATLLGNWRCDEGYGKIAFDYTGIFNALLGGTNAANRPDWIVSTVLKPPDFIGAPLATLIAPLDDMQPAIVVQNYAELLRAAAPEPRAGSQTRPKSKKVATPARKEGRVTSKSATVKARKAPKRKAKKT